MIDLRRRFNFKNDCVVISAGELKQGKGEVSLGHSEKIASNRRILSCWVSRAHLHSSFFVRGTRRFCSKLFSFTHHTGMSCDVVIINFSFFTLSIIIWLNIRSLVGRMRQYAKQLARSRNASSENRILTSNLPTVIERSAIGSMQE